MEDIEKKAHIEFLKLSHAQVRNEEETLKSMLRQLGLAEQGARKLARVGANERVDAALTPTPLHTAAEGLAKAVVRKLPGSVLDVLPHEVRAFGAEPDAPPSRLGSMQILLGLQELTVELKKRVAVAIADSKRLERELELQGAPIAKQA